MWKETHAYSLNGIHLIWQYLHDLPNCQIKATTIYITYTVYRLFYYLCIYLNNRTYNVGDDFSLTGVEGEWLEPQASHAVSIALTPYQLHNTAI